MVEPTVLDGVLGAYYASQEAEYAPERHTGTFIKPITSFRSPVGTLGDERICIPVDSSMVVLAAILGIAIGIGVAVLVAFGFKPQVPGLLPAAPSSFLVGRDDHGRIIEVKEVG